MIQLHVSNGCHPLTVLPQRVPVPWWLGEYDEGHVCGDCRKQFADEATFYCHTCGRDLCPECVNIGQENRDVQCSHCARSQCVAANL